MSDGADVSNQVRGRVNGPVVQAGSIHQVVMQPAAEHGAAAMFSQRGDIATFTGRDEELRTLLAALPDGDGGGVPVIAIHTVDGMPGVGKTAFTVHAAHRLAARFPDGNLFLDLQGHAPGQPPLSPGAALESLLRASGMDPKLIPTDLADRARLWRDRMAGKRVLLVLDDAADHDQVRALLPGTGGSLVLITSRHRLAALDGVTPLTLGILPTDQAIALLTRLAGRCLTPDGDEHAGVVRIVARCGYLPLAITLAGALLRNHPRWSTSYLAAMLADEQERLEHLDVGDRSVQAAFAMSFRHRRAEQQRLFRLLGVHPGPSIDLFAAAALTGDTLRATRRELAGLHDDHLVEEIAPGRYRLQDLLRVYARTLAADLTADDQQAALDRVVSYYLHTVQAANTYLPPYRTSPLPPITTAPVQAPRLDDLDAARAWLAAELPTLSACLRCAATQMNPNLAIHLATALSPFLRLSGYSDQARDIHQAGIAAAVHVNDDTGQANARNDLGVVQYLRGEYAAATESLSRALGLFIAIDDRLGQANVLNDIGRVQRLRGEYAAATESLTRALGLFIAIDDRLGQANALNNLGIVQFQQGERAAAAGSLIRSLALYTAIGDWLGRANALTSLGIVQYEQRENAATTDAHTRALDLYTAIGDRRGQARALNNLGIVQHQRGEYAAAAGTHTRALELYTEIGDQIGQATVLTSLGIVQYEQGEYAAAADNHTRALELFTAAGDLDGQAETHNNLGDLALNYPTAGDPYAHFSRALAIARTIGTVIREAHALVGQAKCLLRGDRATAAAALLRQAQSLCHTAGVPEPVEIRALLSIMDNRSAAPPHQPDA